MSSQRGRPRWQRRTLATCLLVACGWLTSTAPAAAAEPLVTNKALFSIPFFLSPGANRPSHVYLFVSGNKGASWDLYQRRAADEKRFDFQAGEDATYWFAVRTDAKTLTPDENTPPEKIVVVDRTEPELELQISLSPRGDVTAVWQAEDVNLDPTSFRIEYRADMEQWQPVVTTPNEYQPGKPFSGQVEWSLAVGVEQVEIRATIHDRAGNHAQRTKELVSPAATQTRATATRDDGQQEDESSGYSRSVSSERGSRPEYGLDRPDYGREPVIERPPEVRDRLAPRSSDQDAPPPPDDSRWRSFGNTQAWPSADLGPQGDDPFDETRTNDDRYGQSMFQPAAPPSNTDFRAMTDLTPQPRSRFDDFSAETPPLDRQAYQPPVARRRMTGVDAGDPRNSPAPTLPQAVSEVPANRSMSKSSRFHLDYDFEGVALRDVLRVALYVTEDNGRTWREYGTDADRQSPFEVDTGREGVFGFRLLIFNNAGYSARPPQPGERPDMTVVVDMSQPNVRLLDAAPSENKPRTINIRWEAVDRFMRPNPVQISFAPNPNGPWSVVASDVENTGYYAWSPSFRLPPQVYLRVEVRDEAGNVGTAQSSQPIGGVNKPVGIIRRVRPID